MFKRYIATLAMVALLVPSIGFAEVRPNRIDFKTATIEVLEEVLAEKNIELPDDWDGKTLQEKRQWVQNENENGDLFEKGEVRKAVKDEVRTMVRENVEDKIKDRIMGFIDNNNNDDDNEEIDLTREELDAMTREEVKAFLEEHDVNLEAVERIHDRVKDGVVCRAKRLVHHVRSDKNVSFSDVQNVTEEQKGMVQFKFVEGRPDGTLDTEGTINRAETMRIMTRVLGKEGQKPALDDLMALATDVPDSAWFANDTKLGNELGIFYGYDDGTWGPERVVIQAELAVVLWRTFEMEGEYDQTVLPTAMQNQWFSNALAWLVSIGALAVDSLNPEEGMTRGAFMAMTYKTYVAVTDADNAGDLIEEDEKCKKRKKDGKSRTAPGKLKQEIISYLKAEYDVPVRSVEKSESEVSILLFDGNEITFTAEGVFVEETGPDLSRATDYNSSRSNRTLSASDDFDDDDSDEDEDDSDEDMDDEDSDDEDDIDDEDDDMDEDDEDDDMDDEDMDDEDSDDEDDEEIALEDLLDAIIEHLEDEFESEAVSAELDDEMFEVELADGTVVIFTEEGVFVEIEVDDSDDDDDQS